MSSNTDLVLFVKKALNEKWGYCLGSFGNILTPSFLDQKLKQGHGVGAYNTRHKAYLQTYLNKRVSDCYGLVKGFLWWNGGNVKYSPTQDRNQEGAYRAAKEKGPLSNMPEMLGLILWMPGHAGIYIGNGEFIECVGAPVGMRKGMIRNGRVTTGSKFTHWFKDSYIRYPVDMIAIDIMGQRRHIKGRMIDDVNYVMVGGKEVPIRDVITALGMTVGWDNVNKVVTAR